ncbi:MAG: hypothetical protein JWL67_2510 [Solirubrobacterales bacterium]|jgi:hypothetical protein|nr:hypothetical protein [Solirubrobacterales bacterium]
MSGSPHLRVDDPMTDALKRLSEILAEEAHAADQNGSAADAKRLRGLAGTTADLTPAELTWVREASEEDLRGFASSLRLGCPPEEGDSSE